MRTCRETLSCEYDYSVEKFTGNRSHEAHEFDTQSFRAVKMRVCVCENFSVSRLCPKKLSQLLDTIYKGGYRIS